MDNLKSLFQQVAMVAVGVPILLVGMTVTSQRLQAQNKDDAAAAPSAMAASTSQRPGPVDSEISPALAKELEAMKARIAQLEAELKIRGVSAAPATNRVVTPSNAITLPAGFSGVGGGEQSKEVSASAKTDEATAPKKPKPSEPFAWADWTWLNGTPRNKDAVWDSKFFTPEIRFDTHFVHSFNKPRDDTMGGSSEIFRSNEFQVEQISVGGDFHWQNVRGRILTMNGLFGVTTPRNDASPGRGQWDLRGAYKYVSEAYGGYHFDVKHGLNVDAGIFVSYIGLFSYYNFDNWAYQPSYVSSNTPWFFNGMRIPPESLSMTPIN